MAVRKLNQDGKLYYYCSRHYQPWDSRACSYRKFIPGSWDESVWDLVYALLVDNSWIEEQIKAEEKESTARTKLLDMELGKITQNKAKIAKVQEGFEAGTYKLDEARIKINKYQGVIIKAEQEIQKYSQKQDKMLNKNDVEALKQELKAMAESNLTAAGFAEKKEVISRLEVKVYPSEDLAIMRIRLGGNLLFNGDEAGGSASSRCRKITFASPLITLFQKRIKECTSNSRCNRDSQLRLPLLQGGGKRV